MGSGEKSYMRKGLLEEMCKYLTLYEEAASYIYLCNRSLLNFLIQEENFVFFFISVGVPHISDVVFSPHMPDALDPLVDILGVELGEVGNAGKQDPGIGPRVSKQLLTIPVKEKDLSPALIKKNKIFLIHKEIQMGSGAKSYMMKGFLIYEEMRKYFTIYDFATDPSEFPSI